MNHYQGKFLEETKEETKPLVETFYLFEENEAQIEYSCNGIELKDGSSFHDMFGELTCVDNAIKDAKELVKHFKLRKESDLVISVKLTKHKVKKKKTGKKCFYDKKQDEYESVGYPERISEETVWSSEKDYDFEQSNEQGASE